METSWARYVAAHNGVEWRSPDLAAKEDCKRHYRGMFSPSLWVTPEYCRANAARLADVPRNFDPTTGRPLRLEAAQRKVPTLVGLDDRSAVEALHGAFYPDLPQEEIAAAVFIDAPPDALRVEAHCRSLGAGK